MKEMIPRAVCEATPSRQAVGKPGKGGESSGTLDQSQGEAMEDKAVGRVTEAAGSLTGDETLEAEGRALGGAGQRSTCPARRGMDSGNRRAGQISSVHRTKD